MKKLESWVLPGCVAILAVVCFLNLRALSAARAELELRARMIVATKLSDVLRATFKTIEGESVRLSDSNARFAVLYFMRANDCAQFGPELEDLSRRFQNDPNVTIAIFPLNLTRNEGLQLRDQFSVKPTFLFCDGCRFVDDLRLPFTPYRIVADLRTEHIASEDRPGVTKEEQLAFLAKLQRTLVTTARSKKG